MGNLKESLQKAFSPDYNPERRKLIKELLYLGGFTTSIATFADALSLNRDVKNQALQDDLKNPNISRNIEQHPPLNLYARYPLRALRPIALAIITSLLWGISTSEDRNKISKVT